jgi:hypothetical protein
MTCPKCLSHHIEAIERWTIAGRKMTIPLVRMWNCLDRKCRHEWPREVIISPIALASPDTIQEVAYEPSQLCV